MDNLNQTFDLIFIDADKENYVKYFQLFSEKLNPNGLIKFTGMPEFADNRMIAPTFPAISG